MQETGAYSQLIPNFRSKRKLTALEVLSLIRAGILSAELCKRNKIYKTETKHGIKS